MGRLAVGPAQGGNGGRAPDRIVVDDEAGVAATRDQSGRAEDSPETTAFQYSHADLDNGLWVYRVEPGPG